MRRVSVAALSPRIVLGDVEANLARVAESTRQAVAAGARLIVAPELAACGYTFGRVEDVRACAMHPDDRRWRPLMGALPDDGVAVVGFAERGEDGPWNSAVVLARHGVLACYRKSHLWAKEKDLFAAGTHAGSVVDTPVGRLGVEICYDNEFPEVPRRLALAGAEILAVPVAWPLVPRPAGERPPEVVQAMAAARSSRIAMVIADHHGSEWGVPWTGGSCVISTDGWVLGSAPTGVTALVDLDARGSKALSTYNDLFADRRPELYAV